MALDIESPLDGFHQSIGGSAGNGTHGGTAVRKPSGMPSVDEADYSASNWKQLKKAIQNDNVNVYIEDNIDVTNKGPVEIGDGVTLFSDYCNPDKDGLVGPYLYHDDTSDNNYSRVIFTHSGDGKPVQLYGIYALGPRPTYLDPDHNSDKFEQLQCSFIHEYATKDAGTFKAVGCRFTGWTLAGIELGAKSYKTDAEVHRCTFERNIMEHCGYGIEHYNGDLWVDKCFFDKCRHGVSGFGHPTETIDITNSVFGPGLWASHAADMHCLANNMSNGDDTAGKHLRIRNSSFMSTQDVGGYGQEGVAIRGVSVNESQIWNCDFWHDSAPDAPGEQGSAIRQEVDGDWKNLKLDNNLYDNPMSNQDIGAPHHDPDLGADTGTDTDDDGDASEDDDDSADSVTPTTPHQTLSVNGQHPNGSRYVFIVRGDAVTTTTTSDESDTITRNDDHTRIEGTVYDNYVDAFTLGANARIDAAWFDQSVRVTLDDEHVQLAPKVTTYMNTHYDLTEK